MTTEIAELLKNNPYPLGMQGHIDWENGVIRCYEALQSIHPDSKLVEELEIRLNSLEGMAIYKDNASSDWYMTPDTYKQVTGSITRCAKIASELLQFSQEGAGK